MQTQSERRSRMGLVVALVLALGFGGVMAANAENSRPTLMRGVAVGFESQPWTDQNSDAVATRIYSSGCSLTYSDVQPYQNHNYQLWRKLSTWSWRDHGARMSSCYDTVSWGRAIAGTWKFRVSQINRGNYQNYQRLNVDALTIYW